MATDPKQLYTEHFAAFEKSLNGEAESALHKARRNAFERFQEAGFPTQKNEEWKYTSLSPLLGMSFQSVPSSVDAQIDEATIAPHKASYPVAAELVFIDGKYNAKLSDAGNIPEGLTVLSIADAIADGNDAFRAHISKHANIEDNGFTALNEAFLTDGVFIHAAKNAVIDLPIHVVFYSTVSQDVPLVSHTRSLVVAEQSASVKIVEVHTGPADGVYLSNYGSEIAADENANIEYVLLQQHNRGAFHISNRYADIARNANVKLHSFDFGGRLVRNDITMRMNGEGGEGTLNGLFMPRENQHIDNHTLIDHASPHCDSHELYKGILDDESRGVFSGKIIVRPDSQKTDAKQSNNNLLLSDKALVDTKPQLEIFADDVKCTHGATIGRVADEALFYLRTRGINLDEAYNMLSYAFASEIVEHVSVEGVRTFLDRLIHDLLADSISKGVN